MIEGSSKKPKLLLITSNVTPTSAQGIRYLNLFEQFSKKFELYHLTHGQSIFDKKRVNIFAITSFVEKLFGDSLSKIFYKVAKLLFFPDHYRLLINFYEDQILEISKINFSVIIVGVTPFSLLALNKKIKETFPRAQLVNDLSDPFSANADFFGKSKKILYAIKFEKKYLTYVDLLVVLNDRIKEYYESRIYINTATIEQGLNEIFIQKSIFPIIENWFILSYAGNFYKGFRDPENLLKAISHLKFPIKVNVFGGNFKESYNKNLRGFINRFPYISQNELVDEYSRSHLLIVIDNFYGIQVPGKTFECFAYNRPVLLIYNNPLSPTLEYIRNSEGIFAVENRVDLIIEKIKYIYDNYYTIQKKCDYKDFLWERLSNKYLDNLSEIDD